MIHYFWEGNCLHIFKEFKMGIPITLTNLFLEIYSKFILLNHNICNYLTDICLSDIQISHNLWNYGHHYSFLFHIFCHMLVTYYYFRFLKKSEKMVVLQQCILTVL